MFVLFSSLQMLMNVHLGLILATKMPTVLILKEILRVLVKLDSVGMVILAQVCYTIVFTLHRNTKFLYLRAFPLIVNKLNAIAK